MWHDLHCVLWVLLGITHVLGPRSYTHTVPLPCSVSAPWWLMSAFTEVCWELLDADLMDPSTLFCALAILIPRTLFIVGFTLTFFERGAINITQHCGMFAGCRSMGLLDKVLQCAVVHSPRSELEAIALPLPFAIDLEVDEGVALAVIFSALQILHQLARRVLPCARVVADAGLSKSRLCIACTRAAQPAEQHNIFGGGRQQGVHSLRLRCILLLTTSTFASPFTEVALVDFVCCGE